jgi:hypothetical protein
VAILAESRGEAQGRRPPGWPQTQTWRTITFVELVLRFLVAILGWQRLFRGLADTFLQEHENDTKLNEQHSASENFGVESSARASFRNFAWERTCDAQMRDSQPVTPFSSTRTEHASVCAVSENGTFLLRGENSVALHPLI